MYRSLTTALIGALLLLVPVVAPAQTPAQTPAQSPPPAPPPLSAYGALPAMELVELSPSGRRLALVTVVGERRALAVIDLAEGRSMGGIGVGAAKVRDLRWIGEDWVLVTTSSTETIPTVGVFQRELYIGQIYEPARRRVSQLIRPGADLFPALLSGVDVIGSDGRPDVLVRVFSPTTPEGIDLYRIDGESGRARRAESMDRDVEDYVLDTSGRSLARSEYDEGTRVWSLLLRQGNNFRETWRTTAPLDPPA